MNSPKGVKSGVPERVSISCPTRGTRHDLPQITVNQSYVAVSEQTTIQHNHILKEIINGHPKIGLILTLRIN